MRKRMKRRILSKFKRESILDKNPMEILNHTMDLVLPFKCLNDFLETKTHDEKVEVLFEVIYFYNNRTFMFLIEIDYISCFRIENFLI